jgi:AraC-like DNA-binding protein
MARNEPLFSFRLGGRVLERIGLRGAEAHAFLAASSMPTSAATGRCTVPLSRVSGLLANASERAKDPLFGLSLAADVPEGTYEAAELLVRTASNVAQGLSALAKNASLVNPIAQFRYEEGKDRAELHYVVPGKSDGLGVHMNEYTIAYVLRGLRLVATGPLPLLSAWFAHERKPADRARVSAFFGCPVKFGASSSGFAISIESARRSLGSSDKVVFDYLSREAEKNLEGDASSPIAVQIARAIEGDVGFRRATLASVAKHLGVTTRTAQRRLQEEGTSFRDVIDGARRRRAEQLAKGGSSDQKIAELLGFADVGSYRRPAKRWS